MCWVGVVRGLSELTEEQLACLRREREEVTIKFSTPFAAGEGQSPLASCMVATHFVKSEPVICSGTRGERVLPVQWKY